MRAKARSHFTPAISGPEIKNRPRGRTRSCPSRLCADASIFDRSVGNFFREYQPVVDSSYLFDDTGSTPLTIAFRTGSKPRTLTSIRG